MNMFSWMIYLASRQEIFVGLLIVLVFAFIICNTLCWMYNTDRYQDEEPYTLHKSLWWAVVLVPLALIVAVLPNERTVMLIAASEMGEKAVNSDVFQTTLKKLTDKVK